MRFTKAFGSVLLIAAAALVIGTSGLGGLLVVQEANAVECLSCTGDLDCPGCPPGQCWVCAAYPCKGVTVTCYKPQP